MRACEPCALDSKASKVPLGIWRGCSAGADGLVVWSNVDKAINNRLLFTSYDDVFAGKGKAAWKELVPYDASRKIEDVTVFNGFIAVEGPELVPRSFRPILLALFRALFRAHLSALAQPSALSSSRSSSRLILCPSRPTVGRPSSPLCHVCGPPSSVFLAAQA